MKKPEKILFVINPIAGNTNKSGLRAYMEQQAEELGIESRVYETRGKNDETAIRKAIADFQPELLLAAGGDGTVNLCASIVKHTPVKLAFIPLGSANGMAAEFDYPLSKKKAFDAILQGTEKPIDTLIINQKYTCLHLSDIGLNAKIVHRFHQEKKRGLWVYARQFFREIFNYSPKKFEFEHKGTRFRKKALMVIIANARKYGIGTIINPNGKIDDGKFEICIVKPYPFWELLTFGMLELFRSKNKYKYVQFISTKLIKIYNLKREMLQIDGEIIDCLREIEVEIESKSLRLVIPAKMPGF